MSFLPQKQIVQSFFDAIERCNSDELPNELRQFVAEDYRFRSVYPWRDVGSLTNAIEQFLVPLKQSFSHLQRRQDIFIGGENLYDQAVWTMSMGHFMGLFDHDFLDIPATGRLAMLRYAEFNRVEDGKITETGLFVDLIGLMDQAGVNPLPPSTGKFFAYPGPRTHDGIILSDMPPSEGQKTLDLIGRMIDDLSALNDSGAMGCDRDILRKTWHENMLWYGPCGIGATYTIERYQQQHQLPFRAQLSDKKFEGHVCRIAEGDYACFFGWPNLSNSPLGGWLGLPGGSKNATMQVVDVYRRSGDKLAENWVLIDIPYWLKQQGLDVLERNRQLRGLIQF